MNFLSGWRTIIVSILALLWAVLDTLGIDVPLQDQEAVATGIFALIVIVTRLLAKGPVPVSFSFFKKG